eukprot:CAMPEP_0114545448 /NCGR_PEP_ID=MMETSP0114-20121206/3405_1 /TAXON_ID=31324 /ORGANISM="Goniomonas sp, Strain m" /LENGTH=273 /DNA_ID=CAMNT_0001729875 /DNA_START=390 /DNA_END=1208 /DNA_ORIENTATION=-
MVSTQLEYAWANFSVIEGYHIFQWSYVKSLEGEFGRDKAQIREVGWSGTASEPTCSKCPVGMTSQPGADRCTSCDFGYVYNTQKGQCVACDQEKYALPGAAECRPRNPCVTSDYVATYSPCDNGKRTKTFSWVQPILCTSTNGVSLPDPPVINDLPCAACATGSIPGPDHTCTECPSGTYASEGMTECKPCPAGTSAVRVRQQSFFYEWAEDMTSRCVGDCGSPGWRLQEKYIDSGEHQGANTDVWLEQRVTVGEGASVTFVFDTSCDPAAAG